MKEAGGEGEEVGSCSTEDWSRFEEPGSQLRSFLDGLQIFIQQTLQWMIIKKLLLMVQKLLLNHQN